MTTCSTSRCCRARRELPASPLDADLEQFLSAARELGFATRRQSGAGFAVAVRLMIQTGRSLAELTDEDIDELRLCTARRARARRPPARALPRALFHARAVLYHLGVLARPPARRRGRAGWSWARHAEGRQRPDLPDPRRLSRATAAHAGPATVHGRATALGYFGGHLAKVDPALTSVADLDRRRHIETYLTAVAARQALRTGEPIVDRGAPRPRYCAVALFSQRHGRVGLAGGSQPARVSRATRPGDRGRCRVTYPRRPTGDSARRSHGLAETGCAPTRCCSRGHRDAHGRAAGPRARLRARGARARGVAEGAARQARHRADGAPRRGHRRPRRPHRRCAAPRAGRFLIRATVVSSTSCSPITAGADSPMRCAAASPEPPSRRHRLRHAAPTPSHLRHGPGQRRRARCRR